MAWIILPVFLDFFEDDSTSFIGITWTLRTGSFEAGVVDLCGVTCVILPVFPDFFGGDFSQFCWYDLDISGRFIRIH